MVLLQFSLASPGLSDRLRARFQMVLTIWNIGILYLLQNINEVIVMMSFLLFVPIVIGKSLFKITMLHIHLIL